MDQTESIPIIVTTTGPDFFSVYVPATLILFVVLLWLAIGVRLIVYGGRRAVLGIAIISLEALLVPLLIMRVVGFS